MAPGGPPGAANRGRGGKFKKFTRGGGKHFSRDLRPLDSDGNEIRGDNDDESSEKESTEDESSSDEEDEKPQTQMTREERRQAAKAKKEAAKAKKKGVPQPGDMPSEESSDEESLDDMPANPNHSKAARTQASAAPATVEETAEGMAKLTVAAGKKGAAKPLEQLSRRERDAVQAQQARERYQKLHEAGKTDEAKADLARLALIREKREAENARKKAEKDEIEEANRAKKAEIETREAKRREAALGPSASAKGKGKAKK